VALAVLGGTITMTAPGHGQAVQPSLDAARLLQAVPGLDKIAHLSLETLFIKPGASLSLPDMLLVHGWARGAVEQGAAGVVVVQGTDTLEESAYLLDLLWDREEPVVFTGAMRSPEQRAPDGPANIYAAIQAAGSPAMRGLGVTVVMDEHVHAARRVRKTDSMSLGAFSSGTFGSLGRFHEGALTLGNRLSRCRPLPPPGAARIVVPLLTAALGDEGEVIRLLADAESIGGLVIAGFGVGHVSAGAADAIAAAAMLMPVVLCTRTGAGPVLHATYGFRGSEQDLIGRGAIPGGWLDARKARVLLLLLLAAGAEDGDIRTAFAEHAACP
jgi:L-asparaginase